MALHERGQRLRLVLMQDAAGGVIGVVDDDEPHLRRVVLLQQRLRQPVVVRRGQRDLYGFGTGGDDDGLIGYPCRLRQQDLVAMVQHSLDRQINGHLAARRYQNTVSLCLDAVLPQQLLLYLLPQLRDARAHHVMGVAPAQTGDGRLGHRRRRIKVRFAAGQGDIGAVALLQLLRPLDHQQGTGRCHFVDHAIHTHLPPRCPDLSLAGEARYVVFIPPYTA